MQFDETGPNTHTRRYWVSATVGIAAMIVFAILSILLLLGMVFGSPPDQADRRFAVPLEPAGLRGCWRLDVHCERAFPPLGSRSFCTRRTCVPPAYGAARMRGLNWGRE